MKRLFAALLILISMLTVSCGRKEKPEEVLTPMNVVQKYGEVMGGALKKAKAMDSLLYMKNKINTFQIQEGRYPYSLNELIEKNYLEKLPEPPKGMSFHYDVSTGKIDVK